MDIYRAQQYLEDIYDYVRDISISKPRMYSKSKDRLQDIAELSLKIANELSSILEDRIISTGRDFEDINGGKLFDTLYNIQNSLNSLYQIAKIPTTPSSDNCKHIFQTYNAVLSNISVPKSSDIVAQFLNLLKSWFIKRFTGHQPDNFRYNISDMNTWIYAWLLAFSYYCENDKLTEFKEQTDKWFNLIDNAENLYTIPKIVYPFVKTTESKHYTLTAVVLWDILMSRYLSNLAIADDKNLYLDAYAIYDRCNSYNPNVLNTYSDFRQNPQILKDLKIGGIYD